MRVSTKFDEAERVDWASLRENKSKRSQAWGKDTGWRECKEDAEVKLESPFSRDWWLGMSSKRPKKPLLAQNNNVFVMPPLTIVCRSDTCWLEYYFIGNWTSCLFIKELKGALWLSVTRKWWISEERECLIGVICEIGERVDINWKGEAVYLSPVAARWGGWWLRRGHQPRINWTVLYVIK